MLKQGDVAPAFELESDAGTIVRSKDLAGTRYVIYFYPKDSTPGCTREAQAFSADRARFEAIGVPVHGVSKDSVKSHGSFRDTYALTIPLLSDPTLALHKAYGAYGEKVMYGKKVLGVVRSTFVVGADGVIERAWPSVKVDGHADQVLAVLDAGAVEEPAAEEPAPKAPAAKKPGAAKKPAKKGAS